MSLAKPFPTLLSLMTIAGASGRASKPATSRRSDALSSREAPEMRCATTSVRIGGSLSARLAPVCESARASSVEPPSPECMMR